MATSGPLDVQRQQRWPKYISGSGLGVDLPGFDDNPEEDDDEGPNFKNIITKTDEADGEREAH